MISRTPNIADAIRSLAPDAEWSIEDESLSNLVWYKKPEIVPTDAEIEQELERLVHEFNTEDEKKETLKISALEKLKNFGLTEQEARAVIGF